MALVFFSSTDYRGFGTNYLPMTYHHHPRLSRMKRLKLCGHTSRQLFRLNFFLVQITLFTLVLRAQVHYTCHKNMLHSWLSEETEIAISISHPTTKSKIFHEYFLYMCCKTMLSIITYYYLCQSKLPS